MASLAAGFCVSTSQNLWHRAHCAYPPTLFSICATLCYKISYLQLDTRDGATLTANPKPAIYWISAFSPCVLMKKEKLSFLIPWQLFRQWDHISLTQFWPISSASWFFILLSYTPFPALNRPFLSQREKSFLIIQPPENHVIFPVCGLLQLHWDIGVFSKSKQNPLTIVLGTRTLV